MTSILGKKICQVKEFIRLVLRPEQEERKKSLTTRFGRAALWTMGGIFISRLISLLVGVVLARMLRASSYGQFIFVQSSMGTVSTLCGLSMGVTVSRHLALLRDTNRARCGRIVALSQMTTGILGITGWILIWILAGKAAGIFPHLQGIDNLIRLAAPAVLFDLLISIQFGILIGLELFRPANLLSVANFGLTGSCGIVGGMIHGSLGAILGWTIGSGVMCLFAIALGRWAVVRFGIPLGSASYRTAFQERAIIWSYSFPATLQSIIPLCGTWLAQALVLRSGGVQGASQWASYSVASQWRWAALYIPNMLSNLTLPFLTNLHGKGETQRLTKFLKYQLIMNISFAIVAMSGILILSPWLTGIYGSDFSAARPCLQILAISVVFAATNSVLKQQMLSLGRMWTYAAFVSIYLGILFLVLISKLNSDWLPSIAFAAATTISEIGMSALLVSWHLRKRKLNGQIDQKTRSAQLGEVDIEHLV